MNNVESLIADWSAKHDDATIASIPDGKIKDMAVNCISLSNAWFGKGNGSNIKKSYALNLFDKDGNSVDALHGVNENSLPNILLDLITAKANAYSKVTLSSFYYDENGKKVYETLGELEIS